MTDGGVVLIMLRLSKDYGIFSQMARSRKGKGGLGVAMTKYFEEGFTLSETGQIQVHMPQPMLLQDVKRP